MKALFFGIIILACLWLCFGVCTQNEFRQVEASIPSEIILGVKLDSILILEDI